MSYLLHHARRTASAARIDENVVLNLPEFDGGAHVRVLVESTGDAKFRRKPPEPRIKLRIADCVNAARLEFSLDSPEALENSLYKINTLIAALHRFRDALAAEAELSERRRHRKEV
jgi:hypothetical protein